MVVVDRFSKYAHFMSLSHPYTAPVVAKVFMDNVYKLHGLPASIVSDRDPIFLSKFWKEMFNMQGVNLLYSSAYHPQTDGQTEIVNKCVENYLRCMTGDNPNQWARWLSLAEWWYNTNFHSSTQLTPCEVLYGFAPPIHIPYFPRDSTVASVDDLLIRREEIIKQVKDNLRLHNIEWFNLQTTEGVTEHFQSGTMCISNYNITNNIQWFAGLHRN